MNSPNHSTVLFLMGPTASGKTDLAIQLVKENPKFEIISVDSAMVYRGMDIGTGKPTQEELTIAPHHLIDIRDPSEPYSAADFRKDALEWIEDIHKRDRIPLLVGGTFLYFRALQQGLSSLPSANPIIRKKLEEEMKEKGLLALHQRLSNVDPVAAKRINQNDTQRILRALEVYEETGLSLSAMIDKSNLEKSKSNLFNLEEKYQNHSFALVPRDRALLHQRIADRFHKMLDLGLVEEVKKLYDRGDLKPDLPALRSVGYRQVWQYLDGKLNYNEMIEKSIAATRQLAKRQLTWLRGLSNINYLEIEKGSLASRNTVVNYLS